MTVVHLVDAYDGARDLASLDGIFVRETADAPETFSVSRSHQAVFQWSLRVASEEPNPPTFTGVGFSSFSHEMDREDLN